MTLFFSFYLLLGWHRQVKCNSCSLTSIRVRLHNSVCLRLVIYTQKCDVLTQVEEFHTGQHALRLLKVGLPDTHLFL